MLIYRKYYGSRLTLRLSSWFYVVMAAAGPARRGIVPRCSARSRRRARRRSSTTRFEWNYTTFLNIAFLGVFAVLYWLYRNRERFGGGARLRDRSRLRHAGARRPTRRRTSCDDGTDVWFCSDRCRERYEREPDRHRPKVT